LFPSHVAGVLQPLHVERQEQHYSASYLRGDALLVRRTVPLDSYHFNQFVTAVRTECPPYEIGLH
jgi:hypothetical protein